VVIVYAGTQTASSTRSPSIHCSATKASSSSSSRRATPRFLKDIATKKVIDDDLKRSASTRPLQEHNGKFRR